MFGQNPFTRGDVNCDGVVDLLDPYKMSKILFEGETQPCDCPEAMDAEVNGAVDTTDTVFLHPVATKRRCVRRTSL